MSKESKDVKIPIKDLLQKSVVKNSASYDEDEFNLLRKYYIACLNLGFFEPNDLPVMIDKFTSKIKKIITDCKVKKLIDSYVLDDSVLYINGFIKDDFSELYEMNFYKAVTETIWQINKEHLGLSNALSEMAAEKIYTMDQKGTRIIMPKTSKEKIGDIEIEIRSGYERFNLLISCVKQLFICRNINENILIHDMCFNGYDSVISELCDKRLNFKNSKTIIALLDNICVMYMQRLTKKEPHPKELEVLRIYQSYVNGLFENYNIGEYFAFLALVTEDSLRNEFIENIDS